MTTRANSWRAIFVPTDTTWHHFQHFRRAFTLHGLPVALYTDGLALFGHVSTADGRDPRSEFQRALTALGVTHLVAPSPQAKGKIERRFGTFQKRFVTRLAYEKVTDYAPAQELLARELARQNRTVCRTTGLIPGRRLRQGPGTNSAPSCAPVRTPACWTSIWRSTSDAGSMPTTKLISSVAVGRSVPPLGIT